jgi:NAD+ synthase
VPEQVRKRPPTTDTYSLPQGQDEFYYALPYDKLDLCLYARNHNIPPEVVAPVVHLTPDQVGRVYQDIDAKRSATRYLHIKAQLVAPVAEVNRELELESRSSVDLPKSD